ncbi:MAG: hypothetical protein M3289_07885, partial [Actinomycetota bacterium]|nr:hypothetical protein [Actinomycetota bacterium]
MGYQLASTIARSFEPLIATALLGRYGYPTVALHMRVMALITIVAIHLAPGDLPEVYSQVVYRQEKEQRGRPRYCRPSRRRVGCV